MPDKNFASSKIIRYIAASLSSLESGEKAPELPDGVTYRQVYAVAKHHTVASALFYILGDAVKQSGDDKLCLQWQNDAALDFAKNLVQTKEFESLTTLFAENEIKFLPMKGFLFKRLWSKPEYRTMADMDFLVEECDIGKVADLLLSHGYVEPKEGLVHDTFDKPPYVHVEIHKTLIDGWQIDFSDFGTVDENAFWHVMSPEDFTVFNIAHMYKHFVSGGCGVRSVFDLHLYFEKEGDRVDHTILSEKLSQKGLYDFYLLLRSLAALWFGESESFTPPDDYISDGKPTDTLHEAEYFISTGGAYGVVENRVKHGIRKKGKLAYVFSRIFPPVKTMKNVYKWLKKAPYLLPIAYVMRLFRGLFNGRMAREVRAVGKVKNK